MAGTVSELTRTLEQVEFDRPVRIIRRRLRGSVRVLIAGIDALLLVAMAVGVLGLSLATALVAAVVWGVLTAVTAPRLLRRSVGVRGLLHAAALAGLGCWIGDALIGLPVPADRLVLLTGLAVLAALAVRIAVRAVPSTPLRVLVVSGEADREESMSAAINASRGTLACVGGTSPELLPKAVELARPDALLVVPGADLAGRAVQRVAWVAESRRLPMLVSPRLADVAESRTVPTKFGSLATLHVRHARRRGALAMLKPLWERSFAAVLLLLLAPVLAVVALAVRLDSTGPVFFRQQRAGRAGAPFEMIKFRTMCQDAEQRLAELGEREGHVLFKMTADPRITRVGALLRRYSLDELPQLINVVRGEMALIGPRPALLSEVEQYDEDPRRRMVVQPGLTGLWQVSGRSDLSWEESVRLDLEYVDNWSLALDASILARTVRAVLSHSGAY
ncbi:MAG: sugar transferase [Nocardioides sp.]|uniref:exopolysaccharide biosynthesis polyprenyl glycosylphosphotransferase n=1 Tax=Nocardioides sp. TaxID=35761 RepID=UPI0039E24D65